MEFIALLARVCHDLFMERKETSSSYRELWSAGDYDDLLIKLDFTDYNCVHLSLLFFQYFQSSPIIRDLLIPE